MKYRERYPALSAKVRLAAEEMPLDVRERLRHRIVTRLDRAGVRPVAYRRVAVVQLAAMILAAMTLLGGTAYAVSRSQPGDFLYPVKESVVGIGRILPSAERLPDEPTQRKVAPEPDPKPMEREEESGASEKPDESKDPANVPGKPASEEAEGASDKPRGYGEDYYDEAAPTEDHDEPASGQYRDGDEEIEEKSEIERREPSGSNRGHRNGYPED
ncbi:MAG: hypothetical protein KGZ89_08815 [Actinobacteria bacterium]|nr:hypothetical protein [Actinomycetota bacterium]